VEEVNCIVLRLIRWLYWIHKNFSRRLILGGAALANILRSPTTDEQARLRIWEELDIEYPYVERFDFLIDKRKKKVTWVGTDFHYQESWYNIGEEEAYVKGRIANDADAIEVSIVKGLNRLIDKFSSGKIDNIMILCQI
jgi:hypothetical protein